MADTTSNQNNDFWDDIALGILAMVVLYGLIHLFIAF